MSSTALIGKAMAPLASAGERSRTILAAVSRVAFLGAGLDRFAIDSDDHSSAGGGVDRTREAGEWYGIAPHRPDVTADEPGSDHGTGFAIDADAEIGCGEVRDRPSVGIAHGRLHRQDLTSALERLTALLRNGAKRDPQGPQCKEQDGLSDSGERLTYDAAAPASRRLWTALIDAGCLGRTGGVIDPNRNADATPADPCHA